MKTSFWLMTAIGSVIVSFGIVLTHRPASAAGQIQQPFSFDLPAPELSGGPWINTKDEKPISIASRKGKVTVVEFWTFG